MRAFVCGLLACLLLGTFCYAGDVEIKLTEEDRKELLRTALTLLDPAPEGADIYTGPKNIKHPFLYDDRVTCNFEIPTKPLKSGLTPKFKCSQINAKGKKDTFKVKYGPVSREIYTEPFTTRLLWLLGFPSDASYPVVVDCVGCPAEPWMYMLARDKVGPMIDSITSFGNHTYADAVIERKYPGVELYVTPEQGWSFEELALLPLNDTALYESLDAQRDALRLIGSILQNPDTKPSNQRVVCPHDNVVKDENGNYKCTQAVMLMQDVGQVLSGGFQGNLKLGDMALDLDVWKTMPVWSNPSTCETNAHPIRVPFFSYQDGTLGVSHIKEAGRALLAERFATLTREKLVTLFTFARFHRQPNGHTPEEWADVMLDKIEQVVKHTCPK
eukprot:Colp12_sorted_trinity150504_noHs@8247